MTAQPPARKPDHSRLIIGGMLALVVLGGIASFFISKREIPAKVAPARSIIFVTPIPRPDPKPIPEPSKVYPQVKVEEKMVVQDPLLEKNPPLSQPVINTSLPGGLDSTANGKRPSVGLGHLDTVRNNRSDAKWDYYAAKVQTAIKDALGGNDQTKSAIFSMEIQVWADADGRITQTTLVGTSGNLSVDRAVKNQVLTGLKLPSPPPVEMPMPIHLRISALKPPAN